MNCGIKVIFMILTAMPSLAFLTACHKSNLEENYFFSYARIDVVENNTVIHIFSDKQRRVELITDKAFLLKRIEKESENTRRFSLYIPSLEEQDDKSQLDTLINLDSESVEMISNSGIYSHYSIINIQKGIWKIVGDKNASTD